MWDLIVSVPDHCLSFYFLLIGQVKGVSGVVFQFYLIFDRNAVCKIANGVYRDQTPRSVASDMCLSTVLPMS